MFFAASEIIHKKQLLLCVAVLTASSIFNTAGVQGLVPTSTSSTSAEFSDEAVAVARSDMKDDAPPPPRNLAVIGSDGDATAGTYLEEKEGTPTGLAMCVVHHLLKAGSHRAAIEAIEWAAQEMRNARNTLRGTPDYYRCVCNSGAGYRIQTAPTAADVEWCSDFYCADDEPARIEACYNEGE